jgi:hypothetical protein
LKLKRLKAHSILKRGSVVLSETIAPLYKGGNAERIVHSAFALCVFAAWLIAKIVLNLSLAFFTRNLLR